MSLGRTYRTIRHLRPIQIVNRVTRRLRPVPGTPPENGHVALRLRPPVLPAHVPHRDAFRDGSFRFLHRRISFEGPLRWTPPSADTLWLYHLHGFQYLHTVDPATGRRLIVDWIETQRPGSRPAWDPYPISLRLREWIEWVLAQPDLDADTRRRILQSVVHQAVALQQRLEFHLLGNHLLENAITLCWLGTSLEGPMADGLLREGSALLRQELREQVLDDGTHFERSPMYQSLLAEALLRLATVASFRTEGLATQVGSSAAAAGRQMARSLRRLSHPDGDLVLFNDCALGHAARAAALQERFPDLVPPGGHPVADANVPWQLPHAGILGWNDGAGTALVYDVGPIGPRYQPGHGHADTLGFELCLRGERLITDTGVYTYESGSVRAFDRSTRAHNTIELDGRDHAELWAAFRCGQRPRNTERGVENRGDKSALRGAYIFGDHLRFLHRRSLEIDRAGVAIEDEIQAPGQHIARIRLHLAPGIDAVPGEAGLHLQLGPAKLAMVRARGFSWSIDRSPYHPAFGKEIERNVLVGTVAVDDRAQLRWWIDFT